MTEYQKIYSEYQKIQETLLSLKNLSQNELKSLGKRRWELEKQLAKF